MRSLLTRLPLLFALFFCYPAFAIIPLNIKSDLAADYEVVSADFGLFNTIESNQPLFIPTTKVPLKPSQGYGWIIALRTNKSKIKWREEFTLPASPERWSPEADGIQTISPDGKVSVVERETSPRHGMIYNAWLVAPGDPKGLYKIRVFIDNKLVKEFQFTVE